MSEIISPRKRCEGRRVYRSWRYADDPGAGFSFECDDSGNILTPEHPAGRANLARCLAGGPALVDDGVKVSTWTYWEDAVLRCSCGAEFRLYDPMDNFCPGCGAVYNSSGQRMAWASYDPRCEEPYWEEPGVCEY